MITPICNYPLAPIVLFVYKRPWHTKKTIEALKKNVLSSKSELFVYCDAPRNEFDEEKVAEVRKYIKTIEGFKNVVIIKREKNWGLANSIIDGVTTIINQYGKIIVLEDDHVTGTYFLRFMNEALETYKNEDKVFGITGFAYPLKTVNNINNTFFLKDEGCWGWATWRRAWSYFEKDTNKLIQTFTKEMINTFNFEGSMDFWSQVIQNKQGKIDSWAIYWYATVFLNNGLYLHPKNSFVQNIGLDGSGVHCTESCDFDTVVTDNYDILFERDIKESELARKHHIDYYNSLKVPLLKRVTNKVKRILRVNV